MQRLASIQAMRGVAALLVTTLHLAFLASRSRTGIGSSIAELADVWGHLGVDIFFVISGVIIAMQASTESKNTPIEFAVRRIARIYPLYWIVLGAGLILAVTFGDEGAAFWRLIGDPSRLLLIWRTDGDLVPPSWTLPYEVNFYAVATLALVFGRWAVLILWGWAPVQISLILATSLDFIPRYVFFYPTTLEFLFGLAIGCFGLHRPMHRPLLVFAAAFLFALAASSALGGSTVASSPYGRVAGLGIPASIMVWAAISYESRGGAVPRSFRWLGDISYSLYLWHWTTFVIVLSLCPWPSEFCFASVLIAGIALFTALSVSSLSYVAIERPINRMAADAFVKRSVSSPATGKFSRANTAPRFLTS